MIDEWQEVPAIWDGIRYQCDLDQVKGKYILTGSATPVDNMVHHSGAGRIARFKMYTMSLYESGESDGSVSLRALFENKIENSKTRDISLKEIITYIIRGGWLGSISLSSEEGLEITQNYIEDILKFDISSIDGVNRDVFKMRAILRSLARNESTIVNDTTIIKDVNSFEGLASKNTILEYIDVLEKLH